MTLYELHGYQTKAYNAKSDRRIRLKDSWYGQPKITAWIANFLLEFPDGKVVVSRVSNVQRRNEKKEKVFVQTAKGKS